MSDNIEKTDIPDEIELLLPWYVAGTLDEQDQAQVESYLTNNPQVRDQLDLVDDEIGATIHANEEITGPSAGALDRLMDAIAAEAPAQSSGAASSMPGMFASWLSDLTAGFASPAMKAAGALAALVIVVQGITLGGVLFGGGKDDGGKFIPASGGEQIAGPEGPAFLVKFAANANASAIAQLLQTNNLRIVDGPKPGGLFRIVASVGAEKQKAALLAKLKAANSVVAAAFPAESKGTK